MNREMPHEIIPEREITKEAAGKYIKLPKKVAQKVMRLSPKMRAAWLRAEYPDEMERARAKMGLRLQTL